MKEMSTNSIVFISTWMSLRKITSIITKETGYKSPYYNVSRSKGKPTNRVFAVVPTEITDKLINIEMKGIKFQLAIFNDYVFDEGYRGLYIPIGQYDDERAIRGKVNDVIFNLTMLNLIDGSKCYLSKKNRLFVTSNDLEAKILFTFINGAPYVDRGKMKNVRASYLRKRTQGVVPSTVEEKSDTCFIEGPLILEDDLM